MRKHLAIGIALLWGAVSCSDSNNMYTHIPAQLVVDNVYTAPALQTACNSLGEYCTVTMDGQKIYFRGSKETSVINLVALNNYNSIVLGLGGLIIGLPSLPEIGEEVSKVVCYDLNCPNCYRLHGGITKRMEVTGNTAKCKGCQRTYDLDSQGMVSHHASPQEDDGHAIPLFRYRASYVGTALVVSNR